MFLELHINDKPGLFLVDTGAGISVIDINQTSKYGIRFFEGGNTGTLEGLGGAQSVLPIGKVRIQYQGYVLKGLRFYGVDLGSLNRRFEKDGMRILGVIGADFLSKRRAVIDFESHQIEVELKRYAIE